MNDNLKDLVNPEFDFPFNGQVYSIRKATLDKAVQYQQRVKELENSPSSDLYLVAYCIYIMLKDKDTSITEDFVLQNTRADIDTLEVLTTLGFMNPSKLEMVKAIQKETLNRLTSNNSSV